MCNVLSVTSHSHIKLQVCLDPYRVYEHCKLKYDEMKTLVVDNFVSLVNARKFNLGNMSDYFVVKDTTHNSNGESLDVCTNLLNSASFICHGTKLLQ